MARLLCLLVGLLLLVSGLKPYLPDMGLDAHLNGLFPITKELGLIHLGLGVIAFICATRYLLTKVYFALLGLLMVGASLFSFWHGGDLLLIKLTLEWQVLYLGLGVVALYLGFTKPRK